MAEYTIKMSVKKQRLATHYLRNLYGAPRASFERLVLKAVASEVCRSSQAMARRALRRVEEEGE